jgi:hypothetical protein
MNNEQQPVKINIFYIIAVIVMAIMQVVILNGNSTSGEKLTVLSRDIQTIENENTSLSQQIASASALTTLSTKAQAYGYTNTRITLSLTQPLPIAFSGSTL